MAMEWTKTKKKAITFSFDDGVTQDIQLINLLDKYDLRATFNLNSELLGQRGMLAYGERPICHYKIHPSDVKRIYQNHEVASHTLTHPNLTTITDDSEVIRQVEQDRLNLSDLVGYEVVGMAYPCGGINNDERVARLIRENTGVKYCRTITSTKSFDVQENLYQFNPSVYTNRMDDTMDLAHRFLELEADEPQILYIWGHAYEFDYRPECWVRLEELFKLISHRGDIFYGTNKEVLL